MNIYKYLSLVSGKVPSRIKLLGIISMFFFKKRMIGIFLDPVMGCNLKCKMCHFSDKEKIKDLKGIMQDEQLDQIERNLMPYALKLQIGCAAEPSLFSNLLEIIRKGKKAGIPYISLTTNGIKFVNNSQLLKELYVNGLNEITLSTHGLTKDTYETLMQGSNFEDFKELIEILSSLKKKYPNFIIRINFTVNSSNLYDLMGEKFWNLWVHGVYPDIIQLRPVQKLGETEWKDFDLSTLKQLYDETFGNIIKTSKEKGILCIAPTKKQLDKVTEEDNLFSFLINKITYCYISPSSRYQVDYQDNEDFFKYHKRVKTVSKIIKAIVSSGKKQYEKNATKKMNYQIR